jgi:hypothetical protein
MRSRRAAAQGGEMKRYQAHIDYSPTDWLERDGFRSLVAAVKWITRLRLGVRCHVTDERGVVCYERP